MKKNKLMRASALLLTFTLITSCFVGGTFAKYVREAAGADGARAAKWGVTIQPNGEMFSNSYATDDPTAASLFTESVISTDKVLAPGTKGELNTVVLGGTPEVAVAVSYTSDLELVGWTVPAGPGEPAPAAGGHWEPDGNGWQKMYNIGSGTDVQPGYIPTADGVADGTTAGQTWTVTKPTGNPVDGGAVWQYVFVWVEDPVPPAPAEGDPIFYCPVVINVGPEIGGITISGLDFTSAADFEYAVQGAINAYSSQYAPGTDLSTVAVPEVSWKWEFNGNNVKDTHLGDQAVNGEAPYIALGITTTVTQLD